MLGGLPPIPDRGLWHLHSFVSTLFRSESCLIVAGTIREYQLGLTVPLLLRRSRDIMRHKMAKIGNGIGIYSKGIYSIAIET